MASSKLGCLMASMIMEQSVTRLGLPPVWSEFSSIPASRLVHTSTQRVCIRCTRVYRIPPPNTRVTRA
ncbi:OLC1v1024481C1 [Oldenlandia corymbosa var. corymbosa]|uniref:OLC1v1024481C1 n=1 Tax=Oldenlandia corymbosa var. corymbosa TaxID=529605 RepID=A0AAV1C5W8_OLDCO|nr:OLC1v1024481C1 [Oldenlandia corymbosa var. corymbosa]